MVNKKILLEHGCPIESLYYRQNVHLNEILLPEGFGYKVSFNSTCVPPRFTVSQGYAIHLAKLAVHTLNTP